jgi:gluconate 2-dehydrogenase subunit 3-like protein
LAAKTELKAMHKAGSVTAQPTRREILRRMLAGMGASAVWPMVSAAHPFFHHVENGKVFEVQDPAPIFDWQPLVLNQFENRRLVVMAERIIPSSEKAKVNIFIDLLLSVDTEKNQKDFVEALAAFEAESGKRFGKHLHTLEAAQLDELLTNASTGETAELQPHFENLKGWIAGAYYSSEMGMRELGWTPDRAFASFPGCEHSEGHH